MKTKSLSESIRPWLKANLGPDCLGCLTGQSGRALSAAVTLIGLYAYCDAEHELKVLEAFKNVVETMDGQARELAYHSIAHVLDWNDRSRLWTRAGLVPLQSVRRCQFE